MEKIELLSPAGSMQSLYAAINKGADAVYLGGNKFSARAYASNFDNENMKIAVDYCHSYNVKIYVTMNTILKEKELKEAIKYVGYLYEIGVDALIVQDVGLVQLINEKYPLFEIHASTQLTIHNGEGAIYFRDKGFERIVLSRELKLEEIKHISKDLGIETEIFVHGALCVCYSGQCLMSSMIGGRSGNRGRCAQPCRMEYSLKSKNSGTKKGYLLSPKDVCTVDIMKDIIDTGTYSLKVEGRMKRPEYVAGVVENYRNAIDKELRGNKYDAFKGRKTLLQLFNRQGFSRAYLKKNTGKDMMSYSFPKNTGVEIGRADDALNIMLDEDIALGDGIRVKDKGFTISKIILKNSEVSQAKKGDTVKLFPKEYKKNDILFRTSSKILFESLENSLKPYERKLSVKCEVTFKVNEKIKIKANYNRKTYEVEGDIVQEASKKPLDKERIVESLKKSGDYPYKIEYISFKEFEEGFIKVSSLNSLRRELFDEILKDITKEARKREKSLKVTVKDNIKKPEDIDILFTCTTKMQVETLINNGIKNIAVDLFSRGKDSLDKEVLDKYNGVNFYILTPEIIKDEFSKVFKLIEDNIDKIKGIVSSNAGIINVFKDKTTIIGDYKLNVFNSKAIEFYRNDLNNLTLSVEANRMDIKELMKDKPTGIIALIYGKVELMVSEYCPIGSVFGGKSKDNNCNGACTKDEFILVDRMKEEFRVATDKYCRSHILNSVPLNLIDEIEDLKKLGIKSFRIDFKDEDENDVNRVLDFLKGNKEIEGKYYTKGHFRRGVE